MIVYIRHGDDRDDDPDYRHDRHLSSRGARTAPKLAKRLIEKYGHPVAIYVSPYRRAIETLHAMSKKLARPVAVHHDVSIAQYLGDRRDPDVSPKTREVAPISETRAAFEQRIAEHVAKMRRAGHPRSPSAIWCIAHTAVIEAIGECFEIDVPRGLDFLDYVIARS